MTVTIIDYGMGNIWSVQTAVNKLQHPCIISSDPNQIASSRCLILPGVGSFNLAMHRLRELHVDQAINQALNAGARILGICLGMQLLCRCSSEDGFSHGLHILDIAVDRIPAADMSAGPITHVGFNTVQFHQHSRLIRSPGNAADFYFVHSYCALSSDVKQHSGFKFAYVSLSDIPIVAAFEGESIYGVQFHPEKSQSNGLSLLSRFLNPED